MRDRVSRSPSGIVVSPQKILLPPTRNHPILITFVPTTLSPRTMNENVLHKLKVLAESAKYDVSCSSSGTVRRGKAGMVGNTVGGVGICHSFAEDGRCISLLKVMLTNYCL